jgi:hypothetical protein
MFLYRSMASIKTFLLNSSSTWIECTFFSSFVSPIILFILLVTFNKTHFPKFFIIASKMKIRLQWSNINILSSKSLYLSCNSIHCSLSNSKSSSNWYMFASNPNTSPIFANFHFPSSSKALTSLISTSKPSILSWYDWWRLSKSFY